MDKPKDFDYTHHPKTDPYYDMYMQSQGWHNRRKLRLIFDNYTCCSCGSKDNLQIHHKTYRNFGNEPLDDLMTLCASCHERVTFDYGFANSLYRNQRYRENRKRVLLFAALFKENDFIYGGKENMCTLESIRKYQYEYMLATESTPPTALDIQGYFRNRKIEMILRFKEQGAMKQDLIKRGISANMVNKWWNEEKTARELLAKELKEDIS